MEPRAVLQLRGISKEYAGVPALRGVDLTIHRGEVLGLLGQNGAGKSTLVKIMSGAERPSAGEVFINGVQVDLHRPADAQSRGVATIWQELSVIPQLSVAENIYVSDLPRRHGFVHWAEVRRAARDTVRSLGFDIDVDRKVGDLPLAERQVVEIAKAVHHRAQVLLLDEPTATLPKSEVATLFGLLRRLVADGVSVVY
ncbi:MAG: sugar transporter ATPase, partial [Modestobacter sp.]|nr:sugar transporter ATPase [Modestobacter sp.]